MAFNPPQRALVLIVAGASKVTFIALVLSEGTRYLSHQAGVAVAIDSVMVVLFCVVSGHRALGRRPDRSGADARVGVTARGLPQEAEATVWQRRTQLG
jgi:hypothetical protein